MVVTEGRQASNGSAITATAPALTHAPLTVLVNQNTASASEILAGAPVCASVNNLVSRGSYLAGRIHITHSLPSKAAST